MLKESIVIFLKEIRCFLRDKKNFLISILLPFILAPTLLFLSTISSKLTENKIKSNINIAMSDKNNSFYDFCLGYENIKVKDVKNVEDALEKNQISVYINIDENIDEKVVKGDFFKIEMNYSPLYMNSIMSLSEISKCQIEYKRLVSEHKFENVEELREYILKNKAQKTEFSNLKIDTNVMYFNMMFPIVIIIYCFASSSGLSIELTIFEKERGTWEPLILSNVNKKSIAFGKVFAIASVSFLSLIFTILGLTFYEYFSVGFKISFLEIIALVFICALLSFFISSVNFMIGILSKSSREAQNYFVPIVTLFIVPTFFSSGLDISNLNFFELCIPIFNFICIILQILSKNINLFNVLVVAVWLVVYSFITFKFIFRIFEKESIMFKD